MAQVKEYYPSLTITDYKLGEICMFIRNTTYVAQKISEEYKTYISEGTEGGLAPDEEKGGLAPDDGRTSLVGGLAPDDGNNLEAKGGLAPDRDEINLVNEDMIVYNEKKVFGIHSYEAGRIIGINKQDSKLYVQFADTQEGYCHIFKAGISSDRFDTMDKLLQISGK